MALNPNTEAKLNADVAKAAAAWNVLKDDTQSAVARSRAAGALAETALAISQGSATVVRELADDADAEIGL